MKKCENYIFIPGKLNKSEVPPHWEKTMKHKYQKNVQIQPTVTLPMISKRGKIIIATGIGLVIIGFLVLTKTNPQGDNWASIISPFLLIGGYITIAIGIIS